MGKRANRKSLYTAIILVCLCGFLHGCGAPPVEPDTPAESQPVSGVLPEETEPPQEDSPDIISLMQRVDWEHVQPRTWEDPDWRTNIICLAELP